MAKTKRPTTPPDAQIDCTQALDRIEVYRYPPSPDTRRSPEYVQSQQAKFRDAHGERIQLLIKTCVEATSKDARVRALGEVLELAKLLRTEPKWLLTGEGQSPDWWPFTTNTAEDQWRLRRRIAAVLLHRRVEDAAAVAAMIGQKKSAVQSVVTKGRGATAQVIPPLAEAVGVDAGWLRSGKGDAPAWFPEAMRWLRHNERDRGLGVSAQRIDLPAWVQGVRTAWETLLTQPLVPFRLGRLPQLTIPRTAIARQDVVDLFDDRQFVRLALCLRRKLPRKISVADQLNRERQLRASAAGFMDEIFAQLGSVPTPAPAFDYPFDLPDHPAALIGGCLLVAAQRVKKPRHRRDQLLRFHRLLLAQPPGPKGLLAGLQLAASTERTRDPGGAVGTILRAMVVGVCAGPDAEAAETAAKLCRWLLRTPIHDEPAWPLGDLVGLHRDLQAAVARWPTSSTWPSVPRSERLLALVSARAGRIVHRRQLADEYRSRALTDADLTGDLAMLKHHGIVYELLGGYWRFHD